MQAKQFEFDFQDLSANAGWPWLNELTIFGQDLSDTCGDLAVRFITVDSDEEVNLIDFDMATGLMTLQPDLTNKLGIYGLKMQVYLAEYPSVIAEEAFMATVLGTENC
jgi:hypothetical protein